MSNNDDIWSPFFGSMQRRSLLKLFGTSAIAIAGSSALSLRALTQQRSDNPTDCTPTGVAGKTAVAFTPNPHLPVRTRKSAFELSNTEVDRLKSAYAALRKLTTQNPNDPRGWLRQGHVHCWYCGGGSNGREGEEIHGSWLFFPWHRAFLYFHERILCKLINDDTFALPLLGLGSARKADVPGDLWRSQQHVQSALRSPALGAARQPHPG